MNELSSEAIERYARQIMLPEVGGAGQQKLAKARVLIIGMGGLGCPVSLYLAAAGIGFMTLADDDSVALSNLQRQTLYDTRHIGQLKIDVAQRRFQGLNPSLEVKAFNGRVKEDNAAAVMAGHDLVIEGTDSAAARYVIADRAEQVKIPLISAGVSRYDGYITTLKPYLKRQTGEWLPRFDDFFPKTGHNDADTGCAELGVLGPLTGVMGTLMAMEAIKELVGFGDSLAGSMLVFDAISLRFNRIKARRAG